MRPSTCWSARRHGSSTPAPSPTWARRCVGPIIGRRLAPRSTRRSTSPTGCGARALAERARTELRAAGGRSSGPEGSGVGALTASERRVAELAAEGLSNPEIAQALFVTRKTVETHLGHVYRKLGITGRGSSPGHGETPSAIAELPAAGRKTEVQGAGSGSSPTPPK